MTLPIFLQAIAISSKSVREIKWESGDSLDGFENLNEFMHEYSKELRATTFNTRIYDLRTLIRVAKFHLRIKAVTQDYFESCLKLHPWTHQKYKKKELERIETLRIQRALYNFELYFRCLQYAEGYLRKHRILSERLYWRTEFMPARRLQKSITTFFETAGAFWQQVLKLNYMDPHQHWHTSAGGSMSGPAGGTFLQIVLTYLIRCSSLWVLDTSGTFAGSMDPRHQYLF
ncbi:hypothetical protein sscle_07g060000 [Sclerotinia sclerotiorum 1980 UF-70]|uniref:Uncharacterized protein n=1 Tax=Sclerotinia sclerotiorum (strain ATCC 18683 / 1980 / Ss-1) TaxID=665079 RepID=A0A1D9Q8E2_SCLS1|nr:hypothetical protein sscle_07g060000 [Sclerotinia sclerotiorum 1980 UF-70]